MQIVIFLSEFNRDGAGVGMADDVGQSFLSDAKALGFNDGFEPAFQRLDAQAGMKSSQPGMAAGVPLESWSQAKIIEQGGTQVEREILNLLEHSLDRLNAGLQPAQQCALSRRSDRGLEVHFCQGQALADFIMKFARNVTALGFLCLYQFLRKGLKFVAVSFAFEFSLLESF